MTEKIPYDKLIALLDTHKAGDHDWFLSLLDDEKQAAYEAEHLEAVMQMLKRVRIRPHKNAVKDAKDEIAKLEKEGDKYYSNIDKQKELEAELRVANAAKMPDQIAPL